MQRYIVLLLVLVVWLPLSAMQIHHEADEIADGIIPSINISEPIFLDLRCGEWSHALLQSLSQKLLALGADIREIKAYSVHIDNETEDAETSLLDYGVDSANLVQIDMNIKWQTTEQKGFFFYRSERKPVYSFSIKQIRLPMHKLISISTYDYSQSSARDNTMPSTRLRWFEPLFATAAVASLVFLLWTIE